MAPRLSGQNSIFGVVFFVSKSLLGIESPISRMVDVINCACLSFHAITLLLWLGKITKANN